MNVKRHYYKKCTASEIQSRPHSFFVASFYNFHCSKIMENDTSDEESVQNTKILECVTIIQKAAVEDVFVSLVVLAFLCTVTFFVCMASLPLLKCSFKPAVVISCVITIVVAIFCFKRDISPTRSYQLLRANENETSAYAKWLLVKFDNEPLSHKSLQLQLGICEPLPTLFI